MATMNIRVDDALKSQAETLFADLGMNMTTAVNVFLKQAVRVGGIPFELRADPFWSKENQEHIAAAIRDLDAGLGVEHDLIES